MDWVGTEVFAIAELIKGVAWLIPYCARHHPLRLKDNRCRGSACSPLRGQEGRRPQTARVITRCSIVSNGYPSGGVPREARKRWTACHLFLPIEISAAIPQNESLWDQKEDECRP
jgi:hypothetical protein